MSQRKKRIWTCVFENHSSRFPDASQAASPESRSDPFFRKHHAGILQDAERGHGWQELFPGENQLAVFFGSKPGKSAAFEFSGKLNGLFLGCDCSAITTRKGSFGLIDGGEDSGAPSFVFFPQEECFPQCVFLASVAPAIYCLANNSRLIVRKLHFFCHTIKFTGARRWIETKTARVPKLSWAKRRARNIVVAAYRSF